MKSPRAAAVVIAIALSATLLTGCTSGPTRPHRAAATNLINPLPELTNPKSVYFVSQKITPLIEVHGKGAQVFTIARPSDPAAEIQFFLTCTPGASYKVTMGVGFSSACLATLGASGAIPVKSSPGTGPLHVQVTVPGSTHFWLVGIPYPY